MGTVEGTQAKYTLENNMYCSEGELWLRLVIVQGGSALTDKELVFKVANDFGEVVIPADDRLPALTQLILQTNSMSNYAKEQGDYAKSVGKDLETGLPSKQDKIDEDLTTTDKTTTGAINEVKSLTDTKAVSQEAWITPTLINGYTSTTFSYYRDAFNITHFQGGYTSYSLLERWVYLTNWISPQK